MRPSTTPNSTRAACGVPSRPTVIMAASGLLITNSKTPFMAATVPLQVRLSATAAGGILVIVTQRSDHGLYPIGEVARRLGLRASAIRFYEQRGLVEPARRLAGKRWFDKEQVRRLGIILLWKDRGMLSLDRIAGFLDKPGDAARWSESIDAQIDALTRQIHALTEARDFLRHVRHHHPHGTPDGCPHYEELLTAGADARP